jgi:hypothetical protein
VNSHWPPSLRGQDTSSLRVQQDCNRTATGQQQDCNRTATGLQQDCNSGLHWQVAGGSRPTAGTGPLRHCTHSAAHIHTMPELPEGPPLPSRPFRAHTNNPDALRSGVTHCDRFTVLVAIMIAGLQSACYVAATVRRTSYCVSTDTSGHTR